MDMETQITIRRAERNDELKITSVMEQASHSLPDSSWFVADDVEFVIRHLEKEGMTLLAFIKEEPAGYLMIRIPETAEDNLGWDLQLSHDELMCVAHMESIAVLPQFRGLGVAGKLLMQGEEILRQKGYSNLLATVHPNNLASLHNFEKLGYGIKKKVLKYGGKERLIVYKQLHDA